MGAQLPHIKCMPNKQIIYNYLEKLKEVISRLKTFKQYSLPVLQKDDTLQWALDRGVQLAVECSVDIGEEIITGLDLKKPMSAAEVFDILIERHIILPNLGGKLKRLVKYRNELIHEYLLASVKQNYEILHKDLQYIEAYLQTIGMFIKKHVVK